MRKFFIQLFVYCLKKSQFEILLVSIVVASSLYAQADSEVYTGVAVEGTIKEVCKACQEQQGREGQPGQLNEAALRILREGSKPQARNIPGYSSCSGIQYGVASVYGIKGRDNRAGKRTANGEIMSPEKMRAATFQSAKIQYPLGTWVIVRNGDKKQLVCINDTGGGRPGRIIDLSLAVSRVIGNGDLGKVEVQCAAKPTDGSKADPANCDDQTGKRLSLQLGVPYN